MLSLRRDEARDKLIVSLTPEAAEGLDGRIRIADGLTTSISL